MQSWWSSHRNLARGAIFLWTFLVLFLSFLFASPSKDIIWAATADCTPNLIEGLRTECQDFVDPNGQLVPGAEYYKCADAIQCDNENQRCCVVPEDGSYGGNCVDPGTIDRTKLGTDGQSMFNFKPKVCKDVDEEALSIAGQDVMVVPPVAPADPRDPTEEQSLEDYISTHGDQPSKGQSTAGKPIIEEIVQVETRPFTGNPIRKTVTWLYSVDDDKTRRYYYKIDLSQGLHYYVEGEPLVGGIGNLYSVVPREVRAETADSGPLKNLGCKLGNAFLNPLYNMSNALNRLVTNQSNLPDVSLLCGHGVPSFSDASVINFGDDGRMTGLDQTDCHCVDANSGPGTAAVLLCTRFIGGIEDGNTGGAQWRALLPAPNAGGVGSTRFTGLLFGAIEETDTIDEFRQGVTTNFDEFFSGAEVRDWSNSLIEISGNVYIPQIFIQRFFGQDDAPTAPLTGPELDTFKNNPHVRQYISCLACAKYGGFPSALGCMPMDKVERFLAEGVLGVGITFAGALSILCIIYGAIQFQLSGGESAKVQKAQKLITQCIIGLLIIIFSMFLLRFVGVNLLRIYGLG